MKPIAGGAFGVATMACVFVGGAVGMEFAVDELLPGLDVVFAHGTIEEGDAEKLTVALGAVGRDDTGNKILALHSNGGSVLEALRMADVINAVGGSTVVPPGAICASACALIVYVAGEYKVVVEGGLLGMHTCYSGDGIRHEVCNTIIAERALGEGVAYGSVMAFMEAAGPSDMIYFSAEDARCYGLIRYPGEEVPSAQDAPCVVSGIRQR